MEEEESFYPNLDSLLEVSLVEDTASTGTATDKDKESQQNVTTSVDNVPSPVSCTESTTERRAEEPPQNNSDAEADDDDGYEMGTITNVENTPTSYYQNDTLHIEDFGPVMLDPKYHSSAPVSEEETTAVYNKVFKDLGKITHMRLHCTICNCHIGCDETASFKMSFHKILRVLVCHDCDSFYGNGEFEIGDDGSEMYCRWCGQGGQVFCCSHCPSVFCKKCIRRNMGKKQTINIDDSSDWICYVCDTRPLWEHRALCTALSNFIKQQNEEEEEKRIPKEEAEKRPGYNAKLCCKGEKVPYHRAGQPLRVLQIPLSPEEAQKLKEAVEARKEMEKAKVLQLLQERNTTSSATTASTNTTPAVAKIVPVDMKLLLKPTVPDFEMRESSAKTLDGINNSTVHVFHKPTTNYDKVYSHFITKDNIINQGKVMIQNPPPLTPLPTLVPASARPAQSYIRVPAASSGMQGISAVNKVQLSSHISTNNIIYTTSGSPLPAVRSVSQISHSAQPRLIAPSTPSRYVIIANGQESPTLVPISALHTGTLKLVPAKVTAASSLPQLTFNLSSLNPSVPLPNPSPPTLQCPPTVSQDPSPSLQNNTASPQNHSPSYDPISLPTDNSENESQVESVDAITENESQLESVDAITIDDDDIVEVPANDEDKLTCDWILKAFRDIDQTSRLLVCYTEVLRRKFQAEVSNKGLTAKGVRYFAGILSRLLEKATVKLNSDRESISKEFKDWLLAERERHCVSSQNEMNTSNEDVAEKEPELDMDVDCESEPDEQHEDIESKKRLEQDLNECSETLSGVEMEENPFSGFDNLETRRRIPAFRPFYTRTVRDLLRDKYSCKFLFQLISEQSNKDKTSKQHIEDTVQDVNDNNLDKQVQDINDNNLDKQSVNIQCSKDKQELSGNVSEKESNKKDSDSVKENCVSEQCTRETVKKQFSDVSIQTDDSHHTKQSSTADSHKLKGWSSAFSQFVASRNSFTADPTHSKTADTSDHIDSDNETDERENSTFRVNKTYNDDGSRRFMNGSLVTESNRSFSSKVNGKYSSCNGNISDDENNARTLRKRRCDSGSSYESDPPPRLSPQTIPFKKTDPNKPAPKRYKLDYTDVNSKPSTSWATPPLIRNRRKLTNSNAGDLVSHSSYHNSDSKLPCVKLERINIDTLKSAMQKNLIKPCSVTVERLNLN